MEENSSSQMGRFCSQWLLEIRFPYRHSENSSDYSTCPIETKAVPLGPQISHFSDADKIVVISKCVGRSETMMGRSNTDNCVEQKQTTPRRSDFCHSTGKEMTK